jgi:hypothetical protein
MNTIEGTLEIEWESRTQPAATPRYRLRFQRYKGFIGGAQPHKSRVGEDALEAYLLNIRFEQSDAKEWIKQAHEKGSISIPNVKMPETEMAGYEQARAV